jgi:hypothetical protein
MNHINTLICVVERLMEISTNLEGNAASHAFDLGYTCAQIEIVIDEMQLTEEKKKDIRDNQRHGC